MRNFHLKSQIPLPKNQLDVDNMLLKRCVTLPRKYSWSFLSTLSKTLPATESGSIRNGILFSDSEDIVIPSTNLTDLIFERIRPFHKYKAVVSNWNKLLFHKNIISVNDIDFFLL